MAGSLVIVFRETLEAALVVAIVLGATQGIAGRRLWIGGGIAAGIAGAVLVAISAGLIASALQGVGQELLNAGVLLVAVVMLAWHNAWMASHGKQLASSIRELGHDLRVGNKRLLAVAVVVAVAVLREGAETVLFLYSLMASGAGLSTTVVGGFAGLALGVVLGWLVYRGLLAIPLRHFFKVVSWMILLLASGLAASAAGFLNQAGLLPALGRNIWNTSDILSQQSWFGMLLHILVGYADRPMGIQILFYVVTLCGILALVRWGGQMDGKRHGTAAP